LLLLLVHRRCANVSGARRQLNHREPFATNSGTELRTRTISRRGGGRRTRYDAVRRRPSVSRPAPFKLGLVRRTARLSARCPLQRRQAAECRQRTV